MRVTLFVALKITDPFETMKHVRLTVLLILLFFLAGCATWEKHGVTANENNRIRVGVLPIVVTAEIDKASDIVSNPPEMTSERDYINAQINEVAARLTEVLIDKLRKSKFVDVVPISRDDLLHESVERGAENSWSVEELQSVKKNHKVQAVQALLHVSLAGYGKLKKEWLTFLIGTGIAEGLVQGFLVTKVVDNVWIGIAVALEEIAQEILVWGGGSYLFNAHYSPVTLQAKLTSTADGTIVWDDTVFVSVDKDAIEALPEEEQKKREVHLILTAKKAVAELVDDINDSAENNVDAAHSTSNEFDHEYE